MIKSNTAIEAPLLDLLKENATRPELTLIIEALRHYHSTLIGERKDINSPGFIENFLDDRIDGLEELNYRLTFIR